MYHIVHAPLSTVMRRLLTGYAQQFNRRHKRHGHLFQNRYKSILFEEDLYLLELVRSSGGWSALKAIRSTGLRAVSDERILGSSDFVESVLKQANEEYEKKTFAIAKGLNLDKLIAAVAGYLKMEPSLLASSSRQRPVARARSIICAIAVDKLKISGAKVASMLSLSPSAVSKLASRGRKDSCREKIENDIFDLNN